MPLAAKQQLASLGAPEHAPVYFAADFPATGGEIPAVDKALEATAFVLSDDRNGVYGDYALVSKAEHVHYRWQRTGWSAGMWSPDDEIRSRPLTARGGGLAFAALGAAPSIFTALALRPKRLARARLGAAARSLSRRTMCTASASFLAAVRVLGEDMV